MGHSKKIYDYLGEIRMFAGSFPPRGWMFCKGQILPISSNWAMYSLLGTTYGGDGRTTFALPDIRNRVVAGIGQGPGVKEVNLGEMFGEPHVNLKIENLPPHKHELKIKVSTEEAGNPNRGNSLFNEKAKKYRKPKPFLAKAAAYNEDPTEGKFLGGINEYTGGGALSIQNFNPSENIQYIICMRGSYPKLKQS